MTLYESVLASMRAKIVSGEWPPDAMIPREIDLCQQYGVSRSTIRMAMAKLVEERLLTRIKGVGTYVDGGRRLQRTTLFITSFSRELKARGMRPHTELLSFFTVAPIAEINEKLRLPPDQRLVRITRLRYAKDCFETGPIVLTTSYFSAALMPCFEQADLENNSLDDALRSSGYERTMFDKRLYAHMLSERDCRLLGVPAGALAIRIVSVANDQNGDPLEYTESLYPQSKNEFELEVKL